jgi:hypothetical protein
LTSHVDLELVDGAAAADGAFSDGSLVGRLILIPARAFRLAFDRRLVIIFLARRLAFER